ncbi:MAG TPA: thioredoxin domain-containing protein [Acidobacteriaceae bacterium]
MRLNDMNRFWSLLVVFALAMTLPLAVLPVSAQRAAPPGTGDTFKDTSILKPPAGAKVAIIEFEDLECPACSAAYPTVHAAAAHYNIPLVRRDFPLGGAHIWSFDAAVWARYLQDKVSPKTADDYRGAVFAAQMGIASKDDMLNFTRRFFQTHGLQMPFVPDPTGQFSNEVKAEKAIGEKLGVQHTPTIIVCSQREWVHVTRTDLLYQTIEEVEAKAGPATPVKATPAKKIPAKSTTH